ncbi:transmembrane protein 184A-like, partial [Phalaenopsis equestris]|uniref:transmembrane protein 184A-like n=1 Tax=Phalaenopsis equestris TaxID=78828 RepID=UPI0009E3D530
MGNFSHNFVKKKVWEHLSSRCKTNTFVSPSFKLKSVLPLRTMFPGMDLTKMDPGTLTLLGAACGVMLTMHFTVQLLSQHLFFWKNPKEQKAIIIIILMAPLYAIDSFVGLLDIQGSKAFFTFLDSVKECYEALVIAKFLALMYSYLNISLSKNIVPDEIKGREIHHSFPVSLFLPLVEEESHRATISDVPIPRGLRSANHNRVDPAQTIVTVGVQYLNMATLME